MNRFLLSVLLVISLPVSAQIYRYTDANGNTVFTNQPPADLPSLEINLQQSNVIPAPSNAANAANTTADDSEAANTPPYSTLALSGIPNDDAAIRANNGDFTVTVQIEPPLAPNQSLRLLLDGQAYGQDSTNPQFQLVNIDRGEHSLVVAVVDQQGNVVQQSAPDTFTVQRISLHSPARAK